MPPFRVSLAAAHELLPACRLLFTDDRAEQSRERILAACEPTGLFVTRDSGGHLRAASMVQALPGALGLAWPTRGDSHEAEDVATRAACDWLRGRGVKVCQAFASAGEEEMTALERFGFRHTTELVFLRRILAEEIVASLSQHGEIMPAAGGPDFEAALLATHEGTLDCPELNAARTPAELVEGFAWSPKTEWWLARRGGTTLGVFSLALDLLHKAELTYIGVAPAHRGRGVGASLLRSAINRAKTTGATELAVSVDARNSPATRLYTRHGFAECDRRGVWLARL